VPLFECNQAEIARQFPQARLAGQGKSHHRNRPQVDRIALERYDQRVEQRMLFWCVGAQNNKV